MDFSARQWLWCVYDITGSSDLVRCSHIGHRHDDGTRHHKERSLFPGKIPRRGELWCFFVCLCVFFFSQGFSFTLSQLHPFLFSLWQFDAVLVRVRYKISQNVKECQRHHGSLITHSCGILTDFLGHFSPPCAPHGCPRFPTSFRCPSTGSADDT